MEGLRNWGNAFVTPFSAKSDRNSVKNDRNVPEQSERVMIETTKPVCIMFLLPGSAVGLMCEETENCMRMGVLEPENPIQADTCGTG